MKWQPYKNSLEVFTKCNRKQTLIKIKKNLTVYF
jgi:hypothetical protein